MKLALSLLSLYPAISSFADATHLPLVGRKSSVGDSSRLARRANMFASDLTNTNDVEYFVNITLGGAPYMVQIDTGSSDLWVAADSVPNSKSTGKNAKVTYAVGEADGPIMTADLEFATYKVSQQAFFRVDPSSEHPANIGLIGLGPGSVSQIFNALSSGGSPPVDNIFNQNKSSPNFISALLGRSDDPSNPFPGDITVGTYLAGYEDIQSQPQLSVGTAKHGNQHWSVLLDANGIIGPNGESVSVKTVVSSTKNSKQLTAFFDTGYTLPQVPLSVAQTIYSQIQGAKLINNTDLGEIWSVPCNQEVNITFKAGNQSYHIHPLDATMSLQDLGLSGDGCVGTFQPIAASAASSDIDMILGMAFLRNVYLLVNYGDFLIGTSSKADPFVQLLSTSNDTSVLHQEFVQVRLTGVDTTGTQVLLQPDTSGNLSSSPSSDSDNTKKILIYAGIGVGGLAVLLLLGVLISCMCRRGSKGSKGMLPSPWEGSAGRYQKLDEPAPVAATDMYSAPYGPHGSTAYHPPPSYPHSWQH